MHEHQALIAKRVAVGVAEISFGGGAHVCEDEGGGGFGGESREVDAVPGGDGRSEDAGVGAERGGGVVPDAEAIAVVWAAAVLQIYCELGA